jgi:hypothetical protein
MEQWIRMRKTLHDDARVIRAATSLAAVRGVDVDHQDVTELLRITLPLRYLIVGALHRLWSHADDQINDDDTIDLTVRELDLWLGIPGFCAIIGPDFVRSIEGRRAVLLPGFRKWNALKTKAERYDDREANRRRVREHRARLKEAAQRTVKEPVMRNAPVMQVDKTRLDKTLQKKKIPLSGDPRGATSLSADIVGLNEVAWQEWIGFRRTRRLPVYKTNRLAKWLAQFPPDIQASIVELSIRQEYQGLFAPKGRGAGRASIEDVRAQLAQAWRAAEEQEHGRSGSLDAPEKGPAGVGDDE